MKIVVTAKRVPDTTEVKTDPVTGTLIRKGVPHIVNPEDVNACEAALQIKDRFPGTEVDIMTMGQGDAALKQHELLGMGADHAYLLTDRFFGGADTLVCSRTLAAGIRHLGDVDLVLCGHQAIDGDTAQVGPEIARRLGIPAVSCILDLEISDDQKTATVVRELDDGTETLEVPLPALFTVSKKMNKPRYMTVYNIVDSFAEGEDAVTLWGHEEIGLEKEQLGLKASPTRVVKTFTAGPRGEVEMLEGAPDKAATALVEKLSERHLIK